MRMLVVRDKGSVSWVVQGYLVVYVVFERVDRHRKCFFKTIFIKALAIATNNAQQCIWPYSESEVGGGCRDEISLMTGDRAMIGFRSNKHQPS